MMPMARESEKNACPTASMTVRPRLLSVRPSRLGMTRMERPSRPVRVVPSASVVESVSEKMAMPMASTIRMGMRTLPERSMPF